MLYATAIHAAEELLAKVCRVDVRKALDPLNPHDFLVIQKRLADAIRGLTGHAQLAALKKAEDALDVDWKALSMDARRKAVHAANLAIRDVTANVLPQLVHEFEVVGKETVAGAKDGSARKFRLAAGGHLNLEDERIAKHAAVTQAQYVRDSYGKRADAFSAQARDIVAKGLAEGVGRDQIGADLHAALGAQLGRQKSYFVMVASVHVQRSRSYGTLTSFAEAGIGAFEFMAVLDEVTCFGAGARVRMGNGHERAIERVRPGDTVISCFGRRRRVLAVRVTPRARWVRVTMADGRTFNAAPHHPVLTLWGWKRADTLSSACALVQYEGNELHRVWGDDARVQNTTPGILDLWPRPSLIALGEQRTVAVARVERVETGLLPSYDLEVEGDAGFIVEGVVVHNSEICRFMHGKKFPVQPALDRYAEVAASSDPEDVRYLQPWPREGTDKDTGEKYLYVRGADGADTRIADVKRSGVGALDDKGEHKQAMSDAELAKRGIQSPPMHPHCRSVLLPVMTSHAKPTPRSAPVQAHPASDSILVERPLPAVIALEPEAPPAVVPIMPRAPSAAAPALAGPSVVERFLAADTKRLAGIASSEKDVDAYAASVAANPALFAPAKRGDATGELIARLAAEVIAKPAELKAIEAAAAEQIVDLAAARQAGTVERVAVKDVRFPPKPKVTMAEIQDDVARLVRERGKVTPKSARPVLYRYGGLLYLPTGERAHAVLASRALGLRGVDAIVVELQPKPKTPRRA